MPLQEKPGDILVRDGPGDRVPHGGFVDGIDGVFGVVAGPGDDQDLAGSQKPGMDGVDGH